LESVELKIASPTVCANGGESRGNLEGRDIACIVAIIKLGDRSGIGSASYCFLYNYVMLDPHSPCLR